METAWCTSSTQSGAPSNPSTYYTLAPAFPCTPSPPPSGPQKYTTWELKAMSRYHSTWLNTQLRLMVSVDPSSSSSSTCSFFLGPYVPLRRGHPPTPGRHPDRWSVRHSQVLPGIYNNSCNSYFCSYIFSSSFSCSFSCYSCLLPPTSCLLSLLLPLARPRPPSCTARCRKSPKRKPPHSTQGVRMEWPSCLLTGQ